MILPLRVLGTISTKFSSPITATGPNSCRTRAFRKDVAVRCRMLHYVGLAKAEGARGHEPPFHQARIFPGRSFVFARPVVVFAPRFDTA